jgi:ATP-dependent DNA helicase DinG
VLRARDVLGPGSPLSKRLQGYEDRPGQLAMAEAVEAALLEDRPLFVEAGTGTGKTLAYLVPAILSGRKVVVSTATRALEEQIFQKDLPIVRQILEPLGVTFQAALMKGLGNYLCKRRLHERLASDPGGSGGSDRAPPGVTGGLGIDLARIAEWAKTTESGDRAELAALAEDAIAWRDVQSSSDTRIGAGCTYFDECFVTKMRKDAEDATLVVVNHHLFFADLALRRGRGGDYATVLPPYDAVVFDEAHQIEEIATAFFGVRVSSSRVEALVRDARRGLTAAKLLSALGTGEARSLLDGTSTASSRFFAVLAARGRAGGEQRRILSDREIDDDVRRAHAELDGALEGLWAYAKANDRHEAIAVVARRARELRGDLKDVLAGTRATEDGEVSAHIAWIDVRDRSVSIGASPVELGPTLRASLFDRVQGVVCTSATLATGGSIADASFRFARQRLGAPPGTTELVVPSPFDVPARSALYVPRDLPEPSDPAFERAAVDRIVDLIGVTGGGAFVLCTSTRAMKAFHAALAKRIEQPLFVQGAAPKHLLLARFRASEHGVLVATMSFWEGVDVPGHALRLVVLDKIPFAVPTDPVVAARCAQIEREGGNPFAEYSVPVAAITLKQGFGRLLRTKKDAGIVALLDKRALTKGYGRKLLASLPPATRVSSLDDVRDFWAPLAQELLLDRDSPVEKEASRG